MPGSGIIYLGLRRSRASTAPGVRKGRENKVEALILLAIGAVALPILLLAAHVGRKNAPRQPEKPGPRERVVRAASQQQTCPRCGSPVIQYDDGWECGWCGDYCRY